MANVPGFSVLAWVEDDSPLISTICSGNQDHTIQRRLEVKQELLRDFSALVGIRWGFEISIHVVDGDVYAYGVQPRFTVGNSTLRNAIGDLNEHVHFLRSSANSSLEDLVRYQRCKRKWGVEEPVTDASSGWEASPREETSTGIKRKRF